MRIVKLSVILLALLSAPDGYAQSFMTRTGYVEFHSTVPLHSFNGKSKHLVGKISMPDSTVDFYVDLTTLKTGIGKRDRDMRKTLNTEKFPFAEFYGKLLTPVDLSDTTVQPARVRGEFKVHGISDKVTIEGSLKPTGEGLRIEASWILLLKDHDIEPPGILFYKVDQEQKIHINALLKPTNS